jgi:hypothetical protein
MRWLGYVTLALVFTMGLTLQSDAQVYKIQPIGHVVKNAGKVKLEILSQYKDALLGLNEFSHVLVFYWFERNDSLEKRKPHYRSFCYTFSMSTKSYRIDGVQNKIHR